MSDTLRVDHGRYDPIFEEFVESRLKAARPITVRALARELHSVSDLSRSESYFHAEDYCTRKDLLRARGAEPDTPVLPWPALAAVILGILFLVVNAIR